MYPTGQFLHLGIPYIHLHRAELLPHAFRKGLGGHPFEHLSSPYSTLAGLQVSMFFLGLFAF